MVSKRFVGVMVVLAFFTLVVSSSVLADDGRINRAPYHFGGDTLYCNEADGCKLLNKTGHELAHWPHSDIATAFAAIDSSGKSAQVNGEGQGTYGPMQLWAVGSPTKDNHQLCLIGFDEWGKQNDMCFQVTKDEHYQQAPLPARVIVTEAGVVTREANPDCDEWSVGDVVYLNSDSSKVAAITSIDPYNDIVTFGKYTASCSDISLD